MKIHSDFRDYYDVGLKFGSDPNIKYIRKLFKITINKFTCEIINDDDKHLMDMLFPNFKTTTHLVKQQMLQKMFKQLITMKEKIPKRICLNRINKRKDHLNYLYFEPQIIGFCGNIFPSLSVSDPVITKPISCYRNLDLIAAIPSSTYKQHSINKEMLKKIIQDFDPLKYHFKSNDVSYKCLSDMYEDLKKQRFDDIFIELGVPIFRFCGYDLDTCMLELNPMLQTFSFQKVKEPITAFQELSMYMSNQLARQKDPIPKISDIDMRDEKGFDKWSFRKHKDDNKKK